jgi:hypothetical protein
MFKKIYNRKTTLNFQLYYVNISMVCILSACTNSSLLGTWKLYEAAEEKKWKLQFRLQCNCFNENHRSS